MAGKIDIYKPGVGGVQLTKGEHHLADNELLKSQNAELILDTEKGGEGTLSKRAGYPNLFTTSLGGQIRGMAEIRFIELAPVNRATKTLSSAQLDTLNATPIELVPAGAGVLVPYFCMLRFIRTGAGVWTAAPQFQIVYSGSTTNLLQATSLDGFTQVAASIDKQYQLWRAATFTGVAGTQYKGVPLMARLSADTNPGATASLQIDVLYEEVFGLY